MKSAVSLLRRLARTVLVVFLVVFGSTVLIRFAPGYLSDVREMDARYGDAARTELSAEAARSSSVRQMLSTEMSAWANGSLGLSRQYDVPVLELVLPRLAVTGSLMLRAIVFAWSLAVGASLLSNAGRNPSLLWQAPTTLLLAVPTSAIATICLLAGSGGPVLVMTLLLAARDFKFLDRLLRQAWRSPHLLQAKAQGLTTLHLVRAHILPNVASQLLALATLSIVTALSALVPVEVIFSVPGLGQLAWNAAMNRDLPVLLAVTMIMAIAVTCVGMASDRSADWQGA
ncbi:MAG: ABC transporter permease subunit [Terracidiphilus sp.]